MLVALVAACGGQVLEGEGGAAGTQPNTGGNGAVVATGGVHSIVVARCGDGVVLGAEQCDDGDAVPGDGCSGTCTIEPGYDCQVAGQPCVPLAPGAGGAAGAPAVCTSGEEPYVPRYGGVEGTCVLSRCESSPTEYWTWSECHSSTPCPSTFEIPPAGLLADLVGSACEIEGLRCEQLESSTTCTHAPDLPPDDTQCGDDDVATVVDCVAGVWIMWLPS
jgi:cysteine-rich repeat protein